MSTGKLLIAVLSGVAAGMAIGLLLAPDKGSVTRRKIIDKVSDLSEQIKSTAGEIMEKVSKAEKKAQSGYENITRGINEA